MFGSAILDVITGLVFVYLILSLICSAINEYIAALLNKRGKMLVRGIQSMLRDVHLEHTVFEHPLMASYFPHHAMLTEHAAHNQRWLPGSRWLRRLLTWMFSPRIREARYPSYVSARVFATAFLEKAGYVDELLRREEARRQAAAPGGAGGSPPGGGSQGAQGSSQSDPAAGNQAKGEKKGQEELAADLSAEEPPSPPALGSDTVKTAVQATTAGSTNATPSGVRPTDPATPTPPRRGFFARLAWWHGRAEAAEEAEALRLKNAKTKLAELMLSFRRDATLDAPFSALNALAGVASVLPDAEKTKLVDQALLWRDELESVTSSVETWFNNSMDRVSGAYKRHTQVVLLIIGLIVAFFVNADTIELWKRLSTDPKLREGLAAQAAASLPQVARLSVRDSVRAAHPDTTAADSLHLTQAQARVMYDSASAMLARTNLDFGWSWEDAEKLGFAAVLDSTAADSLRSERIRADSAHRLEHAATHRDSVNAGPLARANTPRPQYAYIPGSWRRPHWTFFWAKLLGLLLTTFALSLGAPFWFDTLNKIINIRAAGRAPATSPAPTPADGTKPGGAKP
ncbi:MAG: hypothetical protein JO306_09525 [Gemmatimonadetes bacterium]|nr:hypothetical protein [Gemmatimonadota bacterium]